MILSTATQQHVRLLIAKGIQDLHEWHEGELRRVRTAPRGGGRTAGIAHQHMERLRKCAGIKVEAYLEGYRLDNKVLEQADIDRIVQEMENGIRNAVNSLLELDSGMSIMKAQMGYEASSIIARARMDLILAMQKALLQQKTAPPTSSKLRASVPLSVDFGFVADSRIREIISRDYKELSSLDLAASPKSVLVLSGGIIEGLLLDALVTANWKTFDEVAKEFLKDLIGPALNRQIIREDRLTDTIRKYRDLIHPGREIRDRIVFSQADANIARSAVDVVIREVREWYSKRVAKS